MSTYLCSGPYKCLDCGIEYDICFGDEKILELKDMNPKFARFSQCESCAIKNVSSDLIDLLDSDKIPEGIDSEIIALGYAIGIWNSKREYNKRD